MIQLDKFQIDSINDIKNLNNVLVVAPTGSGKTLIAEKSVEYYIQNNKRIIYTTPIKALSNQKYNDFKNQNIDVGLLTGDRSINQDANLIIATTEILRNMIFSNDSRLTNTGLIILDEVHYLGDKERGTTWEEIFIHAPINIKFLCLSATIKNRNEFLEWIVSLRGPTSLIVSDNRPVPLEISLVATNKVTKKFSIIKSTKNKKNNPIFRFSKQNNNYSNPQGHQIIKYLDEMNLLPSILFYFSREKVESKARQLANSSSVTHFKIQIKEKFDSVFSDLENEEYTLLNLDEHLWMWSRGVGFHHAGLAPIVKEFVEYLFLNKFINYLYATETLALGINMPAKSIILERLYKYDGIKTRLITQSEFLQLTGRAGRRGIDEKGYAFLSFDKNINNDWYTNLFSLESSNLNSAYSVNYFSIINLVKNHSLEDAIKLLNKSFFIFQKKYKTELLEKMFYAKHNILKELNFLDNHKGRVLAETQRDNLIPAIFLYEKISNKTDDFYLMFVASGITNDVRNLSFNDAYENEYSSFESSLELLNKLENMNNLKHNTNIDLQWFDIINEYKRSQNIEYVVTKFNLNIGDFIKVAKEISELSKKLYTLYDDEEFYKIHKMFDNKLIQKTMS
jgi:ATP-dependent RNA helicase HelY